MQINYVKIKLSSNDINESVHEILSKYKFKLEDLLLSLNDDGLVIKFKYKVGLLKPDFVVRLSNVYINSDDISLDMSILKPRVASLINVGPISNLLNNKLTHLGVRYNNGKIDVDLEKLYPSTPIKNIDIKKVKIIDGYLEVKVANFDLAITLKDTKKKKEGQKMKASYIKIKLTSQDIQSFIDDFVSKDWFIKNLKVLCQEGYFLVSGNVDVKGNVLNISLQLKVEKIQEDVISFAVDLVEPEIANVSFKSAVSFMNKNFSDLTQMGIVDANAMVALNLSKLVALLPINSVKIDKLEIFEDYFEIECEHIDIGISMKGF